MKRATLALLAGLPLLTGCLSSGQIAGWLGIKPSMRSYGPYRQDRAEVWSACRDVLADEGFSFAEVEREDWHLETRWCGYGSDFYYGNKRWRITVDLVDGDWEGETVVEMVAEWERNSARDFFEPDEEDWEHMGADRDLEEQINYRIRTRLTKRDIFYDTYRRLEKEDKGRTKPPDFGSPDDGKK